MVQDDGVRGAATALARIAQVLGVPSESFSDPGREGFHTEASPEEPPGARAFARSAESADLLDAFGRIACPQTRQLCLRYIREVAARETRGAA
ncbi:hypothetical protein [Methylobacterium sp. A54F]